MSRAAAAGWCAACPRDAGVCDDRFPRGWSVRSRSKTPWSPDRLRLWKGPPRFAALPSFEDLWNCRSLAIVRAGLSAGVSVARRLPATAGLIVPPELAPEASRENAHRGVAAAP